MSEPSVALFFAVMMFFATVGILGAVRVADVRLKDRVREGETAVDTRGTGAGLATVMGACCLAYLVIQWTMMWPTSNLYLTSALTVLTLAKMGAGIALLRLVGHGYSNPSARFTSFPDQVQSTARWVSISFLFDAVVFLLFIVAV